MNRYCQFICFDSRYFMINIDSLDGKTTWDRLVQAYGLKNKTALGLHLGISNSTIANRIMRGVFPADYVVRCALETGVSLRWLSTGKGPMFEDGSKGFVSIERLNLSNGELLANDILMFDPEFLPALLNPQCIVDGNSTHIIDKTFIDVANGKWLMEIEDRIGVHDVIRIPVKRIHVSGGGLDVPFECGITDVKYLGQVVMTCQYNGGVNHEQIKM